MQIVAWILIVLAVICGALSTMLILYMNRYTKKSKVTVGTVVGQEQQKKGRFLPVIQFRANKKLISARALVFEDNQVLSIGRKVNIRYLENAKTAPQKWDIRIVGKKGYGSAKAQKMSIIGYIATGAILLVGLILLAI